MPLALTHKPLKWLGVSEHCSTVNAEYTSLALPTNALCNSRVHTFSGQAKLRAIFSKCVEYLSTSTSWNVGQTLFVC